jgi:hypothetical protein
MTGVTPTPIGDITNNAGVGCGYDAGTATDYQVTGQRHDYYTQLYQMGARWYDAYVK